MRQKPKILFIVPDFKESSGGIAKVNRSLLKLLTHLSHAGFIELRVRAFQSIEDENERRNLQKHHPIDFFQGKKASFSWSVLKDSFYWADGIICTHLSLSLLAPLVPRSKNVKWLTWLHGTECWLPLGRLKKKGLLRSDKLVANSKFTAEKARQFNPWLTGPIEVCPLGIEKESPPKSGNDFPITRSDILIVGRMERGEGQKGHDHLIRAMPIILQKSHKTKLVIVGNGPLKTEYEKMAISLGVAKQVQFCGYVDEKSLVSAYRNAGVFAMPSHQEGFGLVYTEAMREGLPCVVSNADAGQEIVRPDCGKIVDPTDRTELANAILAILLDSRLRNDYSLKAQQRFLENYTEEQFHGRVIGLLAEMGWYSKTAFPATERKKAG